MDWVERPWTVRSPNQLDPDWRAALDRYEAGSQPLALRIFVPPWKRDTRNKSKESAWLIADGKDGLSILEKPHDREFVFHQIPYRDAILVEEGTALLLGWIGWWWTRGRSLGRIRIEFHSLLEPDFHGYAVQTLSTWGFRDPRTEPGENRGRPDDDLGKSGGNTESNGKKVATKAKLSQSAARNHTSPICWRPPQIINFRKSL